MDFKDFEGISDQASNATSIGIYILAGVGALLAIVVLAWLLIKFANYVSSSDSERKKEKKKDDEEELFGD